MHCHLLIIFGVYFSFIPLVPAKGPTIRQINSNSTTFGVTWTKLSVNDSNGVIINYEVCYQIGSIVSDNCSLRINVSDVDNARLTKLKPAETYTVAVRAYTKVGPGPLGASKSKTAKESRKLKSYRNNTFRIRAPIFKHIKIFSFLYVCMVNIQCTC